MHIVQSFVCPCPWEHVTCVPRDAMIANKNKNGVEKIIFFFCGFNKFLVTKISKPESIHFVVGFKSECFERIRRNLAFLKFSLVLRGNSIGPVVIGRLNDRKKWTCLFF